MELDERIISLALPENTAPLDSKPTVSLNQTSNSVKGSLIRHVARRFLAFLQALATPPTIALCIGLLVALVVPLKSLFIHTTFNMPNAPDGNPPLSIILETSNFLGAASVPLGLLILGSSLGRMRIPRPISRLPLLSIVSLGLCKLVLLPILGVVLVQGLVSRGVIRANGLNYIKS